LPGFGQINDLSLQCINQKNIPERSSQVAMMRDIYAGAQRVVVFMGDGSYHRIPKGYIKTSTISPIIFFNDSRDDNLIEKFHTSWETMSQRPKWYSFCTICVIRVLSDLDHYKATIHCIANGNNSARLQLFELLRQFTNSPWWQRVWVIPEATVSSEVLVQYGNVRVSWDIFVNAANICDSLGWGQHDAGSESCMGIEREHAKVLLVLSRQVFDIQRLRIKWKHREGTGLLSLLQEFSGRKATDDRDKVFALLGLTTDTGMSKPNYSLTTIEVYRRTFIDLVKHGGSLAVLSGDMKRKNSRDIPTWIPDWSVPMEEPDRQRMQLQGIDMASPQWRIKFIDSEQEYWLQVDKSMRILRDEIVSGKRGLLPREIVNALSRYQEILSQQLYGTKTFQSTTLNRSEHRALHLCYSMYTEYQEKGMLFWSRTTIWRFIDAHISLPSAESEGDRVKFNIIRYCSRLISTRVIDLWVAKLQQIEKRRYHTNLILVSDCDIHRVARKTS
jgi:hypothetical protein